MKIKYSLLFLFIACSLQAQNKIQGLVTDLKEVPVESASIIVVNGHNNKTICTTITDSLGRYSIEIPLENSILHINALGYESYSASFSKLKVDELIFTRLEKKTLLLDEVLVQGRSQARMTREGNKFVIDKIENSPYAKNNNAYTFFRYIPVVDVPVFSGEVTVKGGGRATLQINGKRTHLSMEDMLKSIRAEDIEKIEVIAHPGAEYSGEISIINVVIKKRADEGLKSFLSLSDNYVNVNSINGSYSMSYTRGKTYLTSGIFLADRHAKTDNQNSYRYYDEDFLLEQEGSEKSNFFDVSAFVNLDYKLNPESTLGARISAFGSDVDLKYANQTDYGKVSAKNIDSTFLSTTQTNSSSFFSRLNTNLNYTSKTDEKGSLFLIDLDYIMSRPETKNHSLFDKETSVGIVNESDFIQKNNTTTDGFGLWGRYNHVFDSSTKLNSGVSLTGSLGEYDYFYANHQEGSYISDPNKTNSLSYDDLSAIVYISFQKNWSDKFMTILGLRLANYRAKGLQKETNEKISRNETDLSPSIFLYYAPSDEHDITLNASKSVVYPKYGDLNPFKTYTSPKVYSKGNPDLVANNMYKGGLSYSFFDDYSLDLQGLYVDKISAWFTIPDEDGFIMHTPINYGTMLYIVPSFSASKTFFKGFLYLSGDFDYSYRRFKGHAENIEINFKSWIPSFSLNANIFFDKKKTFYSYLDYSYSGSSKDAASFSPADQRIQIAFTKIFSNSTLMFGFDKELRAKNKLYYETSSYGYTLLRKNYWSLHVTYSISFGNSKVRNINDRSNDEIRSRFD
ncbi:MAG: hypothetical protein PARBA_02149 [Parabacteroides sp.]